MSRAKRIAGVDEAGRGALAGPLVAGAVILKETSPIEGLKDSKKLTPLRRGKLFEEIKASALAWSVAIIDNNEIDKLGLQTANVKALEDAVRGLGVEPDKVVADWYKNDDFFIEWIGVSGGEDEYKEIAAASIIAKVTRDEIMAELGVEYPEYGFEKHKGYGCAEHLAAISEHGICPAHRASFGPCQEKLI